MRIYCVFEDGYLISTYTSKHEAEFEYKLLSKQFDGFEYEIKEFIED